MDKIKQIANRVEQEFYENPVLVIAATAALFTAGAKLMDANTARVSAKTHAREIDRRIAMQTR